MATNTRRLESLTAAEAAEQFRPGIFGLLRRAGVTGEEADDLAAEVRLQALCADPAPRCWWPFLERDALAALARRRRRHRAERAQLGMVLCFDAPTDPDGEGLPLAELVADPRPGPEHQVAEAHELQAALGRLDPTDRRCLLAKAAGWTLAELAEREGVSRARVGQRVDRVRKALVTPR